MPGPTPEALDLIWLVHAPHRPRCNVGPSILVTGVQGVPLLAVVLQAQAVDAGDGCRGNIQHSHRIVLLQQWSDMTCGSIVGLSKPNIVAHTAR
mgnify:CR=1 FL=1